MRFALADEHRTAETAALGVPEGDGVGCGGAEQDVGEAFRRLNITDEQRDRTSGLHQYEAKRQSVTHSDRVVHSASSSAQRGVRQTPQPQNLRQVSTRGERLVILEMDRVTPMDDRIQSGQTSFETRLGTR